MSNVYHDRAWPSRHASSRSLDGPVCGPLHVGVRWA